MYTILKIREQCIETKAITIPSSNTISSSSSNNPKTNKESHC